MQHLFAREDNQVVKGFSFNPKHPRRGDEQDPPAPGFISMIHQNPLLSTSMQRFGVRHPPLVIFSYSYAAHGTDEFAMQLRILQRIPTKAPEINGPETMSPNPELARWRRETQEASKLHGYLWLSEDKPGEWVEPTTRQPKASDLTAELAAMRQKCSDVHAELASIIDLTEGDLITHGPNDSVLRAGLVAKTQEAYDLRAKLAARCGLQPSR